LCLALLPLGCREAHDAADAVADLNSVRQVMGPAPCLAAAGCREAHDAADAVAETAVAVK